ncbi:MAG: transcription termination/antitermination NusG family protein, partial [Candidatus Cloacimonadales bacterium]|nr:transcription termination/antitermination NusG family protein [Candidatus Cloacimonadales bacterium]
MATNKPVEVKELFGDLNPAADDQKWLVVRTKPRREKKLAGYAFKASINYYLPLADSIRVYQKRKIIFTKPLFPGYVFVKCSYEERRTLTITGHTAHFLNVINEAELLEELQQIYKGTQKGAEFRNAKFLESGTKVLITAGPFKGLTGYVENQKDITEVILQVNMLRQAVAVTVKSNQVKVIRDVEED